MRNRNQKHHSLCRLSLTGSTVSGALSVVAAPDFNCFIRQIVVLPATRTGSNPTEFDVVVTDEEGEVFRYDGVYAWFNSIVKSDGTQQPPFMLPAYGTLTFSIEDSTRDEAYTILVYYD